MSQMGRIGGPLLAGNLLRNGADLAFDTDLLYLNVNSKYLGINTNGPSSDLTIGTALSNGGTGTSSIRTVNLIATNTTIGNFTVGSNTIQHLTGGITISPNQSSNPTIVTPGLSTANLYFSGNTLTDTVTNDSINFSPNGTGGVNFANDSGNVQVTVNANLHTVGNITWDGNITFGTNSSERVTFVAEVNSNILPTTSYTQVTPVSQQLTTQDGQLFVAQDGVTLLFTNQPAPYFQTNYLWDLGSNSLLWRNVYTNSMTTLAGQSAPITATTARIGNFTLSGTTISDTANDVSFFPTGTGQVKFNNWPYINANTIISPSGGDFDINSSANGYVKFTGTNGLVIPVGTTSGSTDGRPASPVTGATRWNSTLSYVEIYSGTTWIPAYGNAANATTQNVQDYSTLYSIVFGF